MFVDRIDLASKCCDCVFLRDLDCLKKAYKDTGEYGKELCKKCYVPDRAEEFLFEYLYKILNDPELFVVIINRYKKLKGVL
jgi:hypothetical protein